MHFEVQNTVGTVVKSVGDDDEDVGGDPLAVISVLNTHRYKDLKCLAEIKSYLLSHCESAVCKSAMNAVFPSLHKELRMHCWCPSAGTLINLHAIAVSGGYSSASLEASEVQCSRQKRLDCHLGWQTYTPA
jgi:hypothetical protein